MRVHVVSDVHGNVDALARAGEGCDALIVLGDLIDFVDYHDHSRGILGDVFGPEKVATFARLRRDRVHTELAEYSRSLWNSLEDAAQVVEEAVRDQYQRLFAAMTAPTFATPGNVDVPALWPEFAGNGVRVLDGEVAEIGGLRFGFVGGALLPPGVTPRRGSVFRPYLRTRADFATSTSKLVDVDVLCSHIPPDVPHNLRTLKLTARLWGVTMDRMKMKDLVARYLEHRRANMVAGTYNNVSSSLERLAHEWDATRRAPSKISEDWMREFLYQLRQGGVGGNGKELANSSYNKSVGHFRGFIEYLIRRDIAHPFILDACVLMPREEPKEYLRLTAGQVVRMIETCKDPWERWVLAFASQTLGRDSELRNRHIGHLHVDRGTIDWYRRKTVDVDELFVTQQLAEEWDRWSRAYQAACGNLQGSWRLIPQRYQSGRFSWGYRPTLSPKRVSRVIQRHAARITGDDVLALKGQGAHIMRRSMARALYDRLVAAGMPEPTAVNRVQVTLGHASPGQTMRYIGVQPDRQARNALLIGSNLLWVEQDNVVELRSVT